jgi:hypothetical protein
VNALTSLQQALTEPLYIRDEGKSEYPVVGPNGLPVGSKEEGRSAMGMDGALAGQETRPGGWWTIGSDRSIASASRRPPRAIVVGAIGSVALITLAVAVQFSDPDLHGGAARGAGTVVSTPGAYSLDPTVAGTATFVLDVSSEDDGSAARGQVTFVLPAADFTFVGTSLGEVSVRGGMVEVTGEGTVDHRPGYGFALSAEDRENDGFRLTVWEQATNSIVYDNGHGAPRHPHLRGVRLSSGSIEVPE